MADASSFSEYQEMLDRFRMVILEISIFKSLEISAYLDFSDPTLQSLH